MIGQAGFFDLDERLAGISRKGDVLERLSAAVDFELFRPDLEQAVPRTDGLKGGRPPFDPVLMFKVLILQAMNGLSDEQAEFFLRDRLTWMRFLGLGLGDAVPDANTIWTFRERLTRAGAVKTLFNRFDAALRDNGYQAMSGQLVDATIVAAPRQRNNDGEKQEIKAGRIPKDWQAKPAKLRQKDRDARWTVKQSKGKITADGRVMGDIAIPHFGYKNHVAADRRFGLIRKFVVTDAAAHDGARLAAVLDKTNTAGGVWADTAYRSQKNEAFMAENGFVSHVHRKKPQGKPMPIRTRKANALKSVIRSRIEHVFADQKQRMRLFVRTIGIARATTKIGMANLAYNMRRLIWLNARTAAA